MKDVYLILRDRFKSDFNYFNSEIDNINNKGITEELDEYEVARLNDLTSKRDYAYRQVEFFEELIDYYK